MEDLLVLQMGGTIDKDYPKTKGGYNFEVGEAAVRRVLVRVRPSLSFAVCFATICKKDSLDIIEQDREMCAVGVAEAHHTHVIITHGTDTLLNTAAYLAARLPQLGAAHKVVVLTGAHTPEKFRDSDADFNVGVAVGGMQLVNAGVWVAMNGLILPWDGIQRNDSGQFKPFKPVGE